MSDNNPQKDVCSIQSAVDYDMVADNILDIADFTIEKHEFRNDVELPASVREEAVERIRKLLWEQVEELRSKRQQLLRNMFESAQNVLTEVVEKQSGEK